VITVIPSGAERKVRRQQFAKLHPAAVEPTFEGCRSHSDNFGRFLG
jgi:hypothetical protein